MGIWGWGWGREEEATLIWEGSRHHCVGITKRGEGEGRGGRRMGEAQTRTISGDGVLYCQASILGRKLLATTLMLP